MTGSRASGLLLHPSSLPGPYGIGDLGPEAYRFVDFLVSAGQTMWQILPLGPVGYGNSPYMCFSAFGGNPLLISPELLVREGLLERWDLGASAVSNGNRVDYGEVIRRKSALLKKAFAAFHSRRPQTEEFYQFCEQNAFWLEDYALFMALKRAHDWRVWNEWDNSLAVRSADTLVEWRNRLADEIHYHKFLQYVFFAQWKSLRRYCADHGIHIIGDTPIYVAHDSAEVWARPDLFHLDEQGRPLVVGGVPPDYFSATGQRWGSPVYRWDRMAETGYEWWVDRLRADFAQVDIVRLDHFRGFEAYWEVPFDAPDASGGRWVKGPGAAFFQEVNSSLARLGVQSRFIAEDLGVITPEVDALREHLGMPGMRVLQMAFGTDPKASDYLPHNHVVECVVYTGTHDHNTTVGWYTAAAGTQTTQSGEQIEAERDHVRRYAASDGEEIHWDLIRLALGSVARLAIFPLQDVLGLGTGSRMNRPGAAHGNWEWRFTWDLLTPAEAERLGELTALYERRPDRS